MNVFTFPLENPEDKPRIIKLIQELADLTKSAVTIKDQLCIVTNSTRLSLILEQLACDDPDHPIAIEPARKRRNGRPRTRKPAVAVPESQGAHP